MKYLQKEVYELINLNIPMYIDKIMEFFENIMKGASTKNHKITLKNQGAIGHR